MIEFFKWQGHPDKERKKNVGFYIIQPSKFITFRTPGRRSKYQYLGWFFIDDECHFGDRINHSSASYELKDIALPLTKENWQSMIRDIFEKDWEIEL